MTPTRGNGLCLASVFSHKCQKLASVLGTHLVLCTQSAADQLGALGRLYIPDARESPDPVWTRGTPRGPLLTSPSRALLLSCSLPYYTLRAQKLTHVGQSV